MAKKPTPQPATPAATPAAAPAAPAAPAALANMAATLAATPAAAPAPKVHMLQVAGAALKAAHHVATAKGIKGMPANIAAQAYTLGASAGKYAPSAGHVNAVQWAAVQSAIAAGGGQATGAAIAAAFQAAGLQPALAAGFVAYRTKAGGLAIAKPQPAATAPAA